jgi:hypothetical protein
MSEKLKDCPFCGSTDLEILPKDPSRDGNAWGAVQCVNVDCPTYDILKSHGVRVGDGQDVSDERGSDAYKSAAIAAWNRRTPAPEGEAARAGDIAQMTCFANNHGTLEDWAAWCRISASLASPVVPVGVSREVVENLRRQRDHPTSDTLGFTTIRTCDADAIIAALRPTDTGRE